MAFAPSDDALAIRSGFFSENEEDRTGEDANLVDALFFIGRAVHRLADAVEGSGRAS
jgi:hypothetical protein